MNRSTKIKQQISRVLVLTVVVFSSHVVVSAQSNPFEVRRARLAEKTEQGLILVVNSGGQDYSSGSGENMNFYYLTGMTAVNAILVIEGETGQSTVFLPPSRRGTPVSETASLTRKSMDEFQKEMRLLLSSHPVIWIEMNQLTVLEPLLASLGKTEAIRNITPLIHAMRPVKDEMEIACIRKAAEINALGLVEVMKAAEPGMNEKELDLILDYTFKKLGSTGYSFGTQAASGPNSTSVHYGANDRTTVPGDMMVFDIGAEYQYYTADISRSFPISGKFTKEQREIYSVVLNAQKKAIEKMLPGKSITEAYRTVTQELNRGLFDLGLITDSSSTWQKSFWMQHGWGHHIGLVVHDVSAPQAAGKTEVLEPGMIYTMEPGLYFPSDYLQKGAGRARSATEQEWKAFVDAVSPVFNRYINIGVRIEDDVLITKTGNEILTTTVPKEIEEIESLMKGKSKFN